MSQFTQTQGKRKFAQMGIKANTGVMSYPKKSKASSKKSGASALSKAVMRVVNRHREVKKASYTLTGNLNNYAATGWAAVGVQALSPYTGWVAIGQGSGQGDRIGNRIEIKKATLTIDFAPNGYSAGLNPTPTPQIILGWITTVKNSTAQPTTLGTFFQAGDSTAAPVGSYIDGTRPINTDQYTLYSAFRKKVGYASNTGTGAVAVQANMANNDFNNNHQVRVDITKYLPKYVEYNDTSNTPTSKAVWLFMESVNFDGTVYLGSIIPTNFGYTIAYEFYDA